MRRPRIPTIALLTVAAIALLGAACGSSKSSSKAASTTTTATAATAKAMTDQVTTWFTAADTNHDGRIDQSEADAVITSDFHAMDLNHDDVITMDDITIDVANMKGVPAPPGPISTELPADKDNNGRIDLSEYKQYALEESAPLDPSKDGGVTFDEAVKVRVPGQVAATTSTTSGVLDGSGGAVAFLLLGALAYALWRRPRITAPALLVVALLAGPLASAPAIASAVYNQTGHGQTYSIDFTCGIFCGNHWDIPDGQGRSRPGRSGMYTVEQLCENTGADGQSNTTDHGWSVLGSTNAGGTGLQWTDYGNDGAKTGGANPIVKGACVAAR
jgi:hypothetical protein